MKPAALLLALACAGCGKSATAPATGPSAVTPAPAPAPAPPPAPAAADPALEVEEREADPKSEVVKLRLDVNPKSSRAQIFWGRKRLGVLDPRDGKPLEIERPRSSGPLDLVIRADGFLPYHTRLFTDRDDKLSVRLVRPGEASGMLGSKPDPVEGADPVDPAAP